MNYKDHVKKRLKEFRKEDIIITDHALVRIIQRQISEKEIIENLINPERLYVAIKEESSNKEEKFDCYFNYSKRLCHRYVIVIKNNFVVVTVIKINTVWQNIAERKLKGKK